jgi:tryptophan-rich sensory protein
MPAAADSFNDCTNSAVVCWRTLRGGFFGCVVFLFPLLALEVAVLEDAVSALVLALYILWVGYDLVWLYQMWRLNGA